MLRCSSSLITATYEESTPHSSGLARLASGAFYKAAPTFDVSNTIGKIMGDDVDLKAKLGLNVFKPGKEPHIKIKAGMEKDPRLKPSVKICPAGCYSENEKGEISINVDGCLECGTCRIACGTAVLDWNYPEGGFGIQFRYG